MIPDPLVQLGSHLAEHILTAILLVAAVTCALVGLNEVLTIRDKRR